MSIKEPNAVDKLIGGNLRKLRTLRGMSQTALGDAIGLTFQQVQKYEKGTNRMGGSRVVQMCHVLRVQQSRLFEGTEQETIHLDDPISVLGRNRMGLDLAKSFNKLPPRLQNAVRGLCVDLAEQYH